LREQKPEAVQWRKNGEQDDDDDGWSVGGPAVFFSPLACPGEMGLEKQGLEERLGKTSIPIRTLSCRSQLELTALEESGC
jgi:hypothetical protein